MASASLWFSFSTLSTKNATRYSSWHCWALCVQPCPLLSPSSARVCFSTWCFWLINCKSHNQENLKIHFFIRSYLFFWEDKSRSPSREPSLWLGSFVLMWRSLTQKILAACNLLVPAPCSPHTVSFILQSSPTTSSREFCAGYLRIGVLEWKYGDEAPVFWLYTTFCRWF